MVVALTQSGGNSHAARSAVAVRISRLEPLWMEHLSTYRTHQAECLVCHLVLEEARGRKNRDLIRCPTEDQVGLYIFYIILYCLDMAIFVAMVVKFGIYMIEGLQKKETVEKELE